MEKNEYVVAIDLGTSKVVTLVGRSAEANKIEILAGSVSDSLGGVIRGEIKNAEHISKALKETIDNVEKELNIGIKEAYVGISGQHIKCSKHAGYIFIENNDNEVKVRDVRRLKEDMNNVQIPVGEIILDILPQKYAVDGDSDIKEPVGVIGKKLEATFNIITGDKNAITRVDKCLSRIGINISQTQRVINPLASAEAVLIPDEKELGVAVVDIGGGTTDICIYHDNIVRHVAIIPLGGNIINRDIRSYGILERRVESLKVKFGSAVGELERADKFITIPGLNARDPKEISFRNLAYIIEARMLDIIECVVKEINKSGYKDKLGAGIVLTGGCSKLKNTDILFKNNTGYEVRIAVPENNITAESLELVNSPEYSTAVGLLIKAIGTGVPMNVEVRTVTNTAQDAITKPFAATINQPYQQPQRPVAYQSQPPVQTQQTLKDTSFEDDNEEEITKGNKKGGFFKRMGEKFNGMFDVIDDEI